MEKQDSQSFHNTRGSKTISKDSLNLRLISAIFMVPLALGIVIVGGWLFVIFLSIIACLMGWEWSRMTLESDKLCCFLLSFLGVLSIVQRPVSAFVILFIGVMISLIVFFKKFNHIGWFILGCFYCSLTLYSLTWVRNKSLSIFLWLILLVWATDICAYFVGRKFKGIKLCPAISPNKTWSGLVGGMSGAFVIGLIFANIFGQSYFFMAILSSFVAAWSQIGDLFESWVKRQFSVKDSSQIIPGHGGVLDRMDGLLAAAPLVAILCFIDSLKF